MTRSLDSYRLLGRSGLRVSPLALGALTFGADWGWGSERDEARQIFDAYLDRGGNFIDTANQYTNGTSERLVGEFANGLRDRLVIATKYSLSTRPDDPNSGGNHRKSMVQSVQASLHRLNTDYLDLLYLRAWDGTTPVDEVMRAMDDLSERGLAIADTPAWQIARMQTMADLDHGGGSTEAVGARTPAQLADNLRALEVRIPDDALAGLEQASALQLGFPHEFLARPTTRNNIFGDIKLETG